MPVTTVLNEDTATIVSDDTQPRRFSWSAAFAGAFVATAITLFLLTLGSGVGLSLVTARGATAGGTVTFLTLGAIYFLAAQAFGFAAGGHVVGRLIGPAVETSREEDFRAGVHGLVSWALAVMATATLIALSILIAGSASATGAVSSALAATAPAAMHDGDTASGITSYWVDTLFRPSIAGARASLTGPQYAQLDTGSATDGTTAQPGDQPPPAEPPAGQETAPTYFGGPTAQGVEDRPLPATSPTPSVATATAAFRAISADKAEAGRILAVGMANGATLSADDRAQLARLVAQDTGLTFGAAQERVADVTGRIHRDEVATVEMARKTAADASLWTAFALLFGAIIAIFAAVSARWEDDREAGLFPGTRVSTVKF
jgi:hypothetical protein